MDRLIRTLLQNYQSPDFRNEQNSLVKDVYDALCTSYSNAENEVKIVTNMCQAMDGKSLGTFRFHCKRNHSSRSFVEFYNQGNKLTTKDLADMVIISVATREKEIVCEKIAFVQNKRESGIDHWKIEQYQLYLLQNFPVFKGNRGVFKNFPDKVVFLNHSGLLGNFGLFKKTSEMILIDARNVYKLQKDDVILLPDIKLFDDNYSHNHLTSLHSLLFDPCMWGELAYHYAKYFPNYCVPLINFPFLSTRRVSLNIYEFIRDWTYFSIDEVASFFGKTVDSDLAKFSHMLLSRRARIIFHLS